MPSREREERRRDGRADRRREAKRLWRAEDALGRQIRAACGCVITIRGKHTEQERTGFHLNQRPQCKRRVQRLSRTSAKQS